MKLKQKNLVKSRKTYFDSNNNNFDQKVKESMFGVLYVLLKDDHSGALLHFVLFILEFLEFMIFPFHNEVLTAWQQPALAYQLYKLVHYVNIVYYLKGQSQLVYLSIYYLSVVAVTLVILNIAYVSYSFSRKYFTVTWPLHVLRNIAKIFVTFLFMPLLGK